MTTISKEQATALAKALETERWTTPVALAGGVEVRARLESDPDHSLTDDGDWFGSVHWPERGSRSRPAGCNGAARKIDTRGGPAWWQPPQDLLDDPENLAKLETRVRGYFLEYWHYVGVIVEVIDAPCKCCGERKRRGASLWAIESDAGEYFAEVIADLVSEAV